MTRAVLGGSFDPVHLGHLAMVRFLLDRRLGDMVLVVPAGRSPHKGEPAAGGDHRLAMLSLVFGGMPGVRIDDREIRRSGPSYTVDTLEELAAAGSGDSLRLVIGQDNLAGFPSWRSAQRILDLADLVVLARGGEGGSDSPFDPGAVTAGLRAAGLNPRRIIWAPGFDQPVSSREVRDMLAEGADPAGGLSAEVAAYIRAHGLYRP